jgi:hypothetical protein
MTAERGRRSSAASRQPDSVRVVKLGPASDDSSGTGLRGDSSWNPRHFVLVYDNDAGTGRPVSGSFVENDGTTNSPATGYASFYADFVDTLGGAFGLVVPNSLPNGIRRVELRSRVGGACSLGYPRPMARGRAGRTRSIRWAARLRSS